MRKILVVEDDKLISAIFNMFIKELGHELIGRCTTGKEAVVLSHKLKPDVVLMDIHLDGEPDGIQTAEQLRRELDIPVIYISSDTSSAVIKRAIGSNSYGYLVKPINKQELGISIDIAYYKHRVDQEQKERERGFREFISEAPMPLIIIQEGRIQYLNKLALDVFKTHYMEDLLTLPFLNFVDIADHDRLLSAISEFDDKGIGFEGLNMVMKDMYGKPFDVCVSGSGMVFNKKKSLQLAIAKNAVTKVNILLEELKQTLLQLDIPFFICDQKDEIIDQSDHQVLSVDLLEQFIEFDKSQSGVDFIPTGLSKLIFKSRVFKNASGEKVASIYMGTSK